MSSKRPNPPDQNRTPLFDRGWLGVAVAYIIVFGGILAATGGLPYALDNNESFSTLWHARHLADTDWRTTHGLADEVFAWHRAASPFLHTHQGNFPRIFGFVLYQAGLRSAAVQIAVTTFAVGGAALWLAYRWLRSVGSTTSAVLTCLVLITDYALYGQWQFNTYRVWYGFFFFSALGWAHGLSRHRSWWWWAAGAIDFAAMFYGEYVFAAWVGLLTAIYALITLRKEWSRIAAAWLAIIVGAGGAAAFLLTQLISFMGWTGVRADIGFTLKARNMEFDHAFAAAANQFYRAHHIVFWQNFLDASRLRTLEAFASSILINHLQYYGSWTVAAAIVLLAAVGAGRIRDCGGPAIIDAGFRRLAAGAAILLVGAALFCSRTRWLAGPIEDQMLTVSGVRPPNWLGPTILSGCLLIALGWATDWPDRLRNKDEGSPYLAALTVAALAAYAVIYRIFTGYIFSGYLNRQAPFLVFWTDLLLGAGLAVVWESAFGRREETASVDGQREVGTPHTRASASLQGIIRRGRWALGIGLLLCFAAEWTLLQYEYFRAIPPWSYSFLRGLARPPYRGASFVSNAYPAPIAEQTHAWAYADSALLDGQVTLGPDGFERDYNDQYRWFADAQTNAAYRQPAFGLMIHQPSTIGDALQNRIDQVGADQAADQNSEYGIVGRSLEPLQWFIQDHFSEGEPGHYSIVRLDWDFPPYLRAIRGAYERAVGLMSFSERISLNRDALLLRRRWTVAVEPAGLKILPAGDPPELEIAATIDDRPVFDGANAVTAGWKMYSPERPGSPARLSGRTGLSTRMTAVVVGDKLQVRIRKTPHGGSLRLSINDMEQTLDLAADCPTDVALNFSTGQPHGAFTSIPAFSPGQYLETLLHQYAGHPEAIVRYRYVQQNGRAEDNTRVRIYHEDMHGAWHLADEVAFIAGGSVAVHLSPFRRANLDAVHEYDRVKANGDRRSFEEWLGDHLRAHPAESSRPGIIPEAAASEIARAAPADPGAPHQLRLPLPTGLRGRLQLSVIPSTSTKSGPEYFGLPFDCAEVSQAASNTLPHAITVFPGKLPAGYQFPFGEMIIRLKFPEHRLTQAEPILSTGIEHAGDFVYAIYSDRTHLRLGFDHWFKGGPISPPIAIDYAREHELSISLGSFYPPPDDAVFFGFTQDRIVALKQSVNIRLDGRTVIDAPAEFYEIAPTQITVGRNEIHGTTSGPVFTGRMESIIRRWPDETRP